MLLEATWAAGMEITERVCEMTPPFGIGAFFLDQRRLAPGAQLGQPGDTEQMRARAAVVPAPRKHARIAHPTDVEHAAVLRIASTAVTTLRRALSLPHPHTSHSTKGDRDRQFG